MTPLPYPRIPHVIAGRGTRDDLILGPLERDRLLQCTIEVEEKIDGANVMCWVEDGVVRSSGRSGPSGADRARQFGALRGWTAENSDAILHLLQPGETLYGEWLLLTHTVPYISLPNRFVALDLRKSDGTFLDNEDRRRTLEAAGLHLPPLIGVGRYTLDELELACTRSAWTSGPAEGVIVRPVPQPPDVERVAKLVRSDFVAIDDSEWQHGRPQNRLAEPTPDTAD